MDDQSVINFLKGLVIDGVDAARSGHPGGAMSSMDFAYLLFTEKLRFDPEDPQWMGRDRFILSAGHESMLIYSLLHAQGWLETDDLRAFRQMDSRTPGHPENHVTPGVECTTGPLGQGCAMSVGFALAARYFRERFGDELHPARTWALMGDGCMQEGVTLAAASMAGHQKLGRLIWYYDKNRAQISGSIDRATADDETKVFEGFGWQVLAVNGHDRAALRQAMDAAIADESRPTLIVGDTIMAQGAATKEGDHGTHGAPLPADERTATKAKLGIPEGADFHWPQDASDHFQRKYKERRREVASWRQLLATKQRDKDFAAAWKQHFEAGGCGELSERSPIDWPGSPIATRGAFGKVLEAWAHAIPGLVGGSADLEPSNMTAGFAKAVGEMDAHNPGGRNLSFGVREFPMSAVANGLGLYGGLVPFDATFLAFADYSRPALRLGAIQKVRVIHELTHDSFHLGEDGPTHQPIEQVMSLRAIPDFYVMRPADALECEALFEAAVKLRLPSAHCLTRQKVPMLGEGAREAARGAWVVRAHKQPSGIIFATGSEVALALEAESALAREGLSFNVVSMPCWELFAEQEEAYRHEVLQPGLSARISIEAGTTLGWERFVGMDGLAIGLDRFGASAPAGALAEAFGFTPAQVAEKIRVYMSAREKKKK